MPSQKTAFRKKGEEGLSKTQRGCRSQEEKKEHILTPRKRSLTTTKEDLTKGKATGLKKRNRLRF